MINGLLFHTFLFDKLFIPLWALSWHSSAVLLNKRRQENTPVICVQRVQENNLALSYMSRYMQARFNPVSFNSRLSGVYLLRYLIFLMRLWINLFFSESIIPIRLIQFAFKRALHATACVLISKLWCQQFQR